MAARNRLTLPPQIRLHFVGALVVGTAAQAHDPASRHRVGGWRYPLLSFFERVDLHGQLADLAFEGCATHTLGHNRTEQKGRALLALIIDAVFFITEKTAPPKILRSQSWISVRSSRNHTRARTAKFACTRVDVLHAVRFNRKARQPSGIRALLSRAQLPLCSNVRNR